MNRFNTHIMMATATAMKKMGLMAADGGVHIVTAMENKKY